MKKLCILFFIFFLHGRSFAQSAGNITEEKASDWIRVTAVKSTPKPADKPVSVARKKTGPLSKIEAPPKESPSEFNRTNSEVKRFKKGR